MARPSARIPNLCLFCSMNAWRITTPAQVIARTSRLYTRPFSATSVLARGKSKPSKQKNGPSRMEVIARIPRQFSAGRPRPDRNAPAREESPNSNDQLLSADKLQTLVERSLPQVAALVRADRQKLDAKTAEEPKPFEEFYHGVMALLKSGQDDLSASGQEAGFPSIHRLQLAHKRKGVNGVRAYLHNSYRRWAGYRPEKSVDRAHRMETAADIRFPQEWFPGTRQHQRTWHLHIGPTNSGKTYHALKRLEEAQRGIYAGPLRLLAHEVFERMNAKGIECNLVTGDDIRTTHESPRIVSSTMEMVDCSSDVDVCVIDEIQMIGDPYRGWAWTNAVLGVQAKEVHLCGEERTADLIQKLAKSVGDELIIHRYKRLGPLETQPVSLNGDLRKLEKGDCIVSFSRRSIYALKAQVEKMTGKRCAIIYGSLPPDIRSMQAQLFNDPDNEYDYLVASDAVGMGLNLSIKRVIFETVEKFNGREEVPIEVPQMKQIAGRAGRFKAFNKSETQQPTDAIIPPHPPKPTVGYVTTLDRSDLSALKAGMATEVEPITTAGILPLDQHIIKFANTIPPEEPFSNILQSLNSFLRTSTLFHPCSLEEQIEIAKILDDVNLRVEDRLTFLFCPVGRDPEMRAAVKQMAECVAYGKDGSILKFDSIDLEALDKEPTTIDELRRLEKLHKILIAWLWLSHRFPPVFTPRETCEDIKNTVETMIQQCLSTLRFKRKLKRGQQVLAPGQVDESVADAERIRSLDPADGPESEEVKKYGETGALVEQSASNEAIPICWGCGEEGHEKTDCPKAPRDGRCFQCGKMGHNIANCPSTKCHKCGQNGHLARNCTTKQKRFTGSRKIQIKKGSSSKPDKSSSDRKPKKPSSGKKRTVRKAE